MKFLVQFEFRGKDLHFLLDSEEPTSVHKLYATWAVDVKDGIIDDEYFLIDRYYHEKTKLFMDCGHVEYYNDNFLDGQAIWEEDMGFTEIPSWCDLLDIINRDLKNTGCKVRVVDNYLTANIDTEPQYLRYDIQVTFPEPSPRHFSIVITDEKITERNLCNCLMDAWDYAKDELNRRELQKRSFSFTKVTGWTHDLPALISSITNVPLYFYNEGTDCVENTGYEAISIDDYENLNGYFCVRSDDYQDALDQVYDHDVLGIEH